MVAIPPSDYYVPTLHGKGILINGQHYRLKYGSSTHELMVNDGAFDADESEDLTEDLAMSQNKVENLERQNDRLQQRILELVAQLKEAGITPCEPGPDSERGDLETMEDGAKGGADDE